MQNVNTAATRGGHIPGTEPFKPGYHSLPPMSKLAGMMHALDNGPVNMGGDMLRVSKQFGTNRKLMQAVRDQLPQHYGIIGRFLASVDGIPVGVLVQAKGPGILPEVWMAFDRSGILLAKN
jgi:hypothetical protein